MENIEGLVTYPLTPSLGGFGEGKGEIFREGLTSLSQAHPIH